MKFVILRCIYLNGDFMSRKVYSMNYEIEGALSSIAPPFLQIIEDFKKATGAEETAKVNVSVIIAVIEE